MAIAAHRLGFNRTGLFLSLAHRIALEMLTPKRAAEA